jgi:hypothetical protein
MPSPERQYPSDIDTSQAMIPNSLLPYRAILFIAAIRFVRAIVPWPLVPLIVVLMMVIVSSCIVFTWAARTAKRLSN